MLHLYSGIGVNDHRRTTCCPYVLVDRSLPSCFNDITESKCIPSIGSQTGTLYFSSNMLTNEYRIVFHCHYTTKT